MMEELALEIVEDLEVIEQDPGSSNRLIVSVDKYLYDQFLNQYNVKEEE